MNYLPRTDFKHQRVIRVEGGVDEAGRGPVIGPLVLALVVGSNEELAKLKVRDSKSMRQTTREKLFERILSTARCVEWIVVEPHVIDEYVRRHALNILELDYTVELVRRCRAPVELLYVDSPDPRPDRYGLLLERRLGIRVISLARADEVIPLVSAASIVAKVVREREIAKLKEVYGDFGSGYPSDWRTIEFLRKCLQKGELPPIVRRSWSTVKMMMGRR